MCKQSLELHQNYWTLVVMTCTQTNKLENEDVIKVQKTKCQHCMKGFKQITNFTKQKLQEIGAKLHKAPTK